MRTMLRRRCGVPCHHPGDVAQECRSRPGSTTNAVAVRRISRHCEQPLAPRHHQREAQEAGGPQAGPARGEGRGPGTGPPPAMSRRGTPWRRPARTMKQALDTWNSTAKMLVMATRLCTRYTPSQQQQGRREQRRPLGRQHAPREQEEDGCERDARQHGQQAPGPRLVPERPDADRDQQLRRGRVHPFGRRLAVQVLAARSSRGRPRRRSPRGEAQPGQAQRRRPPAPTAAPAPGRAASQGRAASSRGRRLQELQGVLDRARRRSCRRTSGSTAYSTAITWPRLLKTGPPLPPWVVGASKTMSVPVTSPMCPWVVEGRMRSRWPSASRDACSALVPCVSRIGLHHGRLGLGQDAPPGPQDIPPPPPAGRPRCPPCDRSSGSTGTLLALEVHLQHGQVRLVGVALHVDREGLRLAGEERAQVEHARLEAAGLQRFAPRRRSTRARPGAGWSGCARAGPPGSRSVELHRVHGPVRVHLRDGRAVLVARGVALLVERHPQRLVGLVVERVGALQQGDPPPNWRMMVSPAARSLSSVSMRARVSDSSPRSESTSPPAASASTAAQRRLLAAVFLRAAAAARRAPPPRAGAPRPRAGRTRAVLLGLRHGLAQAGQLRLQLARLVVAPPGTRSRTPPRSRSAGGGRWCWCAAPRASPSSPTCDAGPGPAPARVRDRPGAAGPTRAAHAQLHHVAVAQHGLAHLLAAQERAAGGLVVHQQHVAARRRTCA